MKIEVLVSTMDQNDLSLIKKMKIKTNALIINQCNLEGFREEIVNGNKIRMLSHNERGLSKSRNHALDSAQGDICVIADDDVTYDDDYEKKILTAYKEHPDADIIAFQVIRTGNGEFKNFRTKESIENYLSSMKISSVEITFKRESIIKSNVRFNPLLGAGARFYLGEESVFLYECLRKGLKIVYVPIRIGSVCNEKSSWFEGYNIKYFKSKGASYYAMSNRWYLFLILQFAIRKYKLYSREISLFNTVRSMLAGAKEYRNIL